MNELAIIIPTYGQFNYAERAIRSALDSTYLETHIVVVDDASPNWIENYDKHLKPFADDPELKYHFHVIRFQKNSGLTAAWNTGLMVPKGLGYTVDCEFACVTNSDVVFTPGWYKPLMQNLNEGYALVGPITNAPGSEKDQNVKKWFSTYHIGSDAQEYLDKVSDVLYEEYKTQIVEHPINGFCMMAKTKTWWDYKFADDQPFKPRNEFNSKGEANQTPLMTLQEYELQRRWRARGLKIGFCPGSFVFHYRSVSRGDKYKTGHWYRMKA